MSSKGVGFTAMVIGAVSMIVPLAILVILMVDGHGHLPWIPVFLMVIAGSIIFGCGTIAAAIGLKK